MKYSQKKKVVAVKSVIFRYKFQKSSALTHFKIVWFVQHITTTPYRFDIILAISSRGKFLAQFANEHIDTKLPFVIRAC